MQRSRNEPDFVSACVSLASAGERGVLQQRTCDMSRAVGLRVNKLWPHHGPHILKFFNHAFRGRKTGYFRRCISRIDIDR
jgi:hypothetical protein